MQERLNFNYNKRQKTFSAIQTIKNTNTLNWKLTSLNLQNIHIKDY